MQSLPQLRIRLKKTFAEYYLALCWSSIADPTAAYDACKDYFSAMRDEIGESLFELDFEDEVERLAGEVEQDLRRRHRDAVAECLARDSIDSRFREVVEHAWLRPPAE